MDEFFSLIQENCNGNEKETIEFANEILEEMIRSENFIKEFAQRIELFARQNQVCPQCGEELDIDTYKEESEYQGFPVEEDINNTYCSHCGYVD